MSIQMYAISAKEAVYHLALIGNPYKTHCGRTVIPEVVDSPKSTSLLYWIERQPEDRLLCNQCQEEQPATDRLASSDR